MSRIWGAAEAHEAAAVSIVSARQPEGGTFRSLYTAAPGRQTAAMRIVDDVQHDDPLEEARIEAFTMGFDEGNRVATEAAAADQAAATRLAEALEMLAPAPSGMLSTLLSATVVRLVEQIVGEVEIDIERLLQRCDTVAAFIESDDSKGALFLHPQDMPLLEGHEVGVRLVPDPSMHRGCVRLETADGWVEDGPDVRLSRLRALLDDMEGKL